METHDEALPSDAQAYVGAKIIIGYPNSRDGQPGYTVVYPDGYVSWSPKGTFEEAYRPVSSSEATLVATSQR